MTKKIRIGTRGSELALWQANHIAGLIGRDNCEIIIIKTQGDRIQNVSFDKMEGKGFFTKEIEEALLDGRVDLAVHSLKDMPTDNIEGLKIAAIPERGFISDLLLIRPSVYENKDGLKVCAKSVIGTSSMRRLAQLKNIDSSLKIEPLRGNINTRLRKLYEGEYDAIVMAKAGVERLNLDLSGLKVQELDDTIFLPAPAQGALGLQIREDDEVTEKITANLNDANTALLVGAERAFLRHFGGGCHIPLGALANFRNNKIFLQGIVASPEGNGLIRESVMADDPEKAGEELAELIKSKGAKEYI